MTMAKKRLGVCVVGLGIGYLHANSKIEDVDLYVCDIDKEKVGRVEAELEVK